MKVDLPAVSATQRCSMKADVSSSCISARIRGCEGVDSYRQLLPVRSANFLGGRPHRRISEVTVGKIREYRIHRYKEAIAQRGPTDLIFPKWQRDLFATILNEKELRVDREGRPRTAYSLCYTYICVRLTGGADIYQIAKNCRTSVEMIEEYYTTRIKTLLDSAAIKVMRPKKNKKGEKTVQNAQASAQPPGVETDV